MTRLETTKQNILRMIDADNAADIYEFAEIVFPERLLDIQDNKNFNDNQRYNILKGFIRKQADNLASIRTMWVQQINYTLERFSA